MDLNSLPLDIYNLIYEYVIFVPLSNEELKINVLNIEQGGHISNWNTKFITNI